MDKKRLAEFVLGSKNDIIREKVILAPCWSPHSVGIQHYTLLSDSACNIWNCSINNVEFTYIVSGVGAHAVADIIRALEHTRCKKVLMCGSAGSLDENIPVGSIALPNEFMCCEGASRYHQSHIENDLFGQSFFIEGSDHGMLLSAACKSTQKAHVDCFAGKAVSVDSYFSEFEYLDFFESKNCQYVDMESSAAVVAAKKANISLCVLFCISDNIKTHESLVTIDAKKTEFRKLVRYLTMPTIIEEFVT